MRKIYGTLVIAAALFTTACIDAPTQAPNTGKAEFNNFDFATTAQTTLTVDYGEMGGIRTSVYFELYDTKPVEENASGTAYVKVAGAEPLFASYTDEQGRYTGDIEIPTYAKKLYIYTPAFNAQTLIEATISKGSVVAQVEDLASQAEATTRAEHESRAVTLDGWKKWLGNYDSALGRIEYEYTGTELQVKDFKKIYQAHASVFDTSKACPQEYRSSRDMLINEPAEIAVTMLGGNTCWNSSMGYYFYPEGQKPKSLDEANVIMIFPNTQDGEWSNNRSEARKFIGTKRGSVAQLKYFPNISTGSSEGETTAFPAGLRVGFVLATNAWTNRLNGFKKEVNYRAATSDGLSINNSSAAYQTPRTAVFRYIDKSNAIDAVLFSFEDHVDDENFSDVVFTMVSNPIKAVVDIPEVEVDDQKKTIRTLKGIYAFEDLWPSKGDHDMNDVMVRSNYEKTFSEKGIYEEAFLLKTYMNWAGLESGLAVTLQGGARTATLECSILKVGAEKYEAATLKREGNVVYLTSNVKENIGATYKITAKYSLPIKESEAGDINPFIYCENRPEQDLAAGYLWEVHLPYETPSPRVDTNLFGKSDDRSVPETGIYYVRKGSYPFAFFLAGATDKDVAKLLDTQNEKQPIDQVYPDYAGWATSNGKLNQDWYKK